MSNQMPIVKSDAETKKIPSANPARSGGIDLSHGFFMWSSAAVCIAALLEYLHECTKAMNMNAMLQAETAKIRAQTAVSVANATAATFMDDSNQLMLQMGEQLGSSLSPIAQMGGTAYAAKLTTPASTYMDGMNKVTDAATSENFAKLTGSFAGDRGAQPALTLNDEEFKQAVEFRTKLIAKNYSPLKNMDLSRGMDSLVPGSNSLTLGKALAAKLTDDPRFDNSGGRLSPDTLSKMDDVSLLTERLGSARRQSITELNTSTNRAQQSSTLIGSVGQLATGAVTSGCKGGESQTMAKKAEDSKNQQFANAAQQFMQENNKAEADQSQTQAQNAQTVIRTVAELMQTDQRA